MKYQTITVVIPNDPRKRVCVACGRSVADGEIKVTQMHHYRYAYKPETVKANPILALEYTLELCFSCHKIADDFRELFSHMDHNIIGVFLAHPDYFRDRLKGVARKMLVTPKPLNTTNQDTIVKQ